MKNIVVPRNHDELLSVRAKGLNERRRQFLLWQKPRPIDLVLLNEYNDKCLDILWKSKQRLRP